MNSKKNILFAVTNVSAYPDGSPTGVWFEEYAVPYLIFKGTGYDITVASPKGGAAELDPESLSCSHPDEWDTTSVDLKNTKKLSDVDLEEFDAVYFVGGHGTMFDFPENESVIKTAEYFYNNHKVVSGVCHGPAALVNAKTDDGELITRGKNITAFTNEEEQIVKAKDLIPFLLEDKFQRHGANFIAKPPWTEHVEVDGNLITGQNPASAIAVAEQVIKKLNHKH